MRRTREDILRIIAENRDAIQACGARRLALFGSAARGDAGDDSDADFLVELNRKTFDNYMDLKELLEKLLGCPVDLVMADAVKPRLRTAIERDMVHAEGL
jgi:predicted nucleotidyltransferase